MNSFVGISWNLKNEKAVPEIVYLLRAAEPFSTAVAVVVGKQSQRCTALPDTRH